MKKSEKLFNKLGYSKSEYSENCITYEKPFKKFVKCIEFLKNSNSCYVISYQKDLNSNSCNNALGLTSKEVKAVNKKLKELKW